MKLPTYGRVVVPGTMPREQVYHIIHTHSNEAICGVAVDHHVGQYPDALKEVLLGKICKRCARGHLRQAINDHLEHRRNHG